MMLLCLVLLPALLALCGIVIAKCIGKTCEPFWILSVFAVAALLALATVQVLGGGIASFTLAQAVGGSLTFRMDPFRMIYACLSVFLWLATGIFSCEYLKHGEHRARYYFFWLLTLSGVLGVFLSDDLFTTFCFFELMSFASYPLVIHEEDEEAMKAGRTYLAVAVISGMMLLLGIFFLYGQSGTVTFAGLRSYFGEHGLNAAAYAGGVLALLGFGAKAGMYPLHIWLPQAHPVAPAPASALLSGILTKTGVFGIIVLSADVFFAQTSFGVLLLVLAVITMFLGALLALFSTNLKRTLACSSMSQIGFILIGVALTVLLGEEGGLAQAGAFLHMANHSLIKLVLFLSAGVVAMNLHALELNEIRGFGRKKPFLMIVFLLGALGIMGIPGMNGYVSKTMLHEGIVEWVEVAGLQGGREIVGRSVEWIFLISGGLTVAYMTKLFVCLFVEKNADVSKQQHMDGMISYLSLPSRIVLVAGTLPMIAIGVAPNAVNQLLITPAAAFFGVERFTQTLPFFGWESLKGALISVLIGTAVYLLIVRHVLMRKGVYVDLWPKSLDLQELLYRPLVLICTVRFTQFVLRYLAMAFEWLLTSGTVWLIRHIVYPISLSLDALILLLCKTVLRPYVYRFREVTLSHRVGEWIDKKRKPGGAEKGKPSTGDTLEAYADTISDVVQREYNSFSFAFAMICLGIVIVLLYVLLK